MTDVPVPPPFQPDRRELDFTRAFAFIFKDPEWVQKTLMGGLFVLLSIFIIGVFVIAGYMARLARNVVAGMELPLPAWDDIGAMLAEGLKLVLVAVVYSIPIILAYIAMALLMVGTSGGGEMAQVAGMFSGCGMLAVIPFALVLVFLLPVAMVACAVTGEVSAAFDIPEILRFIRRNFVNYILALVIYWVANFLSNAVGFLLLCVGILFTSFLAYAIGTWAFAETWRLDRKTS